MNQEAPLLSIITVVYNGGDLLEKTILSILNQTYKHIEYIIIDGKSKDKTVDVIKKYADSISYWVSEPDKGIYDAMNKGMNAAKGDYIWFINAGDLIHAADTAELILKTKTADVFYGDTMMIDEDGKHLGLRSKITTRKLPAAANWKHLRMGMVICHQSFIVKKSISTNYDLQYAISADVDWMIKCLKSAKTIVNTQLILSDFLIGGESKKRQRKGWTERFKLQTIHFGVPGAVINHIRIFFRAMIFNLKKL